MPVNIVLADDHEIVLEGIRRLVAGSGRDWEVVGTARDGKGAVEVVKTMKPDLAILDITMPILSGLEAAREIVREKIGCRILMFTMHESMRLGIEAQQAGAQGYVVKSQAARDLIRAIDHVLAGKTFFGAPPEPGPAEGKKRKKNESPNAFYRVVIEST
jgi:two-component system, NarL family, nitrate/nitrite response regulator NarL